MNRPIFFVVALILFCHIMSPAQNKSRRTVIAATTVLDGKGHVLHNTRIVVQDGKILRIDPKARPVDYDLRGLTVLPGWIDSHVHITWSFGPDGRNAGPAETTDYAKAASAKNALVTLMAGVTTGPSVGSPNDITPRAAIARGVY